MAKMEIIEKEMQSKIKSHTVLLFDMDGTLVDTDFANFLSYKEAIQLVVQTDREIQYNPNERFSRSCLITVVPNLTETEYEEIIKQKEENYKQHLPQTKLNKTTANVLRQYSETNTTVLVTNCRKNRAIMTLSYHNLTDKFKHLLFKQKSADETRINKYQNAISSLGLSAQNVFVFENEKQEIQDAIQAGISVKNILSI